MPAKRDDIVIEQGSTYRRVYQLLDTDLSGGSAKSEVRDRPGPDGNLLLSFDVTIDVQYTDDGRPVTLLTLVAESDVTTDLEPGEAVHDIKVTYENGESDRIIEGKVRITEQVTQ